MTERVVSHSSKATRGLFIKEWTQMALLRWVGFALGLAVPPGLLIIARFSEKGWIPLVSKGTHYRFDELLEAPTGFVLIVIWGLMALLFGCHVFSADRGAGTETFLLGAPVSRRKLWVVKFATASLATVVLAIAHYVYWFFMNSLFAYNPFVGLKPDLLIVALIAIVMGLAGGVAGAGIRRVPTQALPLGLLLALMPLVIGGLLVNGFPMASVGSSPRIALGLVVALLIPVGMLLTSYFSEVPGEPIGRRRWARALVGVGISLALPLPLFLALASAFVGANPRQGSLRLQPGGDHLVIFGMDGGSIRSAETGEKTVLAPPIWFARWNGDGSILAICHGGGKFGRLLKHDRLEFRLPDGSPTGAVIEPEKGCQPMAWAGDRIVLREIAFPLERMTLFDPRTGAAEVIEAADMNTNWASPYFFSPVGRDELYLLRTAPGVQIPELAQRTKSPRGGEGPEAAQRILDALAVWLDVELVRIGDTNLRLAAAPDRRFQLQAADLVSFRWGVSMAGAGWGNPGRFWMLATADATPDSPVRIFVDTETGGKIEIPVAAEDRVALLGEDGRWLARIAKAGKGHRLTIAPFDPAIGAPTGEPIVDRSWKHQAAFARVSDDWNRAIVSLTDQDPETKSWGERETWIFNADTGEFKPLEGADDSWMYWLDNRELYSSHQGTPATLNVDTGAVRTW